MTTFSPAGIAMIVSGTADYVDTEQHKEELAVLPPTEGMDIAMIVSGVAVLLFSLAMAFLYVRLARYRRDWGCPCGGMSKKQGLARQLQGDCGSINGGGGGSGAGGPIIALNPSTDPLVTHTQYAPVSEIPMRLEFEERHTLMPANSNNNSNTNKESASGGGAASGAEESERMLADTNDSRIVLRPIGHVEDA